MNKTKFTVSVFLGAIFLTVLTNYLFFNLLTGSPEVEFSKSRWLDYRLNSTSENNIDTGDPNPNPNPLNIPTDFFNCTEKNKVRRVPETKHRKTYTIVTNFVTSRRELSCEDLYITYTSHGDFRYLDNLVPVVERWQGPVSLALYIPNNDVYATLERILYMRECTTPLIKEWVTFHLFSDTKYFNDPLPIWIKLRKSDSSK